MTSRNTTPLLSLEDAGGTGSEGKGSISDIAYRIAFGAIGWPWLLYSLWGGTRASKRTLLERVGLREDALPNLGSWKADTGFLHRIVDAIEELRPANVVELGAGATTLVAAKALELNGGGRIYSFDQHAGFVEATGDWLQEEGVRSARISHAPLRAEIPGWEGRWYDISGLPETIDLLIIDGPPWTVHPFVRGAAEALFDRLSPGAIVLLDDASRPGERVVARRWRRNWPGMRFERLSGSTKGTLVGRKLPSASIHALRPPATSTSTLGWRRAAAIAMVFGAGWLANDFTGRTEQAAATEFIAEADASFAATQARHRMDSQPESRNLDQAEIARMTGIALPDLPDGWTIDDVQVYPSDMGVAVSMMMTTSAEETVSLFATTAETPAESLPLLATETDRSLAYWEEGTLAYAISGDVPARRILSLAAELSSG